MTDLFQLTQDIIDMRKHPLKNNGAARYPKASVEFAAAVAACEDADVLREVIRLDTGHVLPTATKQLAYEKLLAHKDARTPAMLQAFAMHLEMFGDVDPVTGERAPDPGERIEILLAEADAKR